MGARDAVRKAQGLPAPQQRPGWGNLRDSGSDGVFVEGTWGGHREVVNVRERYEGGDSTARRLPATFTEQPRRETTRGFFHQHQLSRLGQRVAPLNKSALQSFVMRVERLRQTRNLTNF